MVHFAAHTLTNPPVAPDLEAEKGSAGAPKAAKTVSAAASSKAVHFGTVDIPGCAQITLNSEETQFELNRCASQVARRIPHFLHQKKNSFMQAVAHSWDRANHAKSGLSFVAETLRIAGTTRHQVDLLKPLIKVAIKEYIAEVSNKPYCHLSGVVEKLCRSSDLRNYLQRDHSLVKGSLEEAFIEKAYEAIEAVPSLEEQQQEIVELIESSVQTVLRMLHPDEVETICFFVSNELNLSQEDALDLLFSNPLHPAVISSINHLKKFSIGCPFSPPPLNTFQASALPHVFVMKPTLTSKDFAEKLVKKVAFSFGAKQLIPLLQIIMLSESKEFSHDDHKQFALNALSRLHTSSLERIKRKVWEKHGSPMDISPDFGGDRIRENPLDPIVIASIKETLRESVGSFVQPCELEEETKRLKAIAYSSSHSQHSLKAFCRLVLNPNSEESDFSFHLLHPTAQRVFRSYYEEVAEVPLEEALKTPGFLALKKAAKASLEPTLNPQQSLENLLKAIQSQCSPDYNSTQKAAGIHRTLQTLPPFLILQLKRTIYEEDGERSLDPDFGGRMLYHHYESPIVQKSVCLLLDEMNRNTNRSKVEQMIALIQNSKTKEEFQEVEPEFYALYESLPLRMQNSLKETIYHEDGSRSSDPDFGSSILQSAPNSLLVEKSLTILNDRLQGHSSTYRLKVLSEIIDLVDDITSADQLARVKPKLQKAIDLIPISFREQLKKKIYTEDGSRSLDPDFGGAMLQKDCTSALVLRAIRSLQIDLEGKNTEDLILDFCEKFKESRYPINIRLFLNSFTLLPIALQKIFAEKYHYISSTEPIDYEAVLSEIKSPHVNHKSLKAALNRFKFEADNSVFYEQLQVFLRLESQLSKRLEDIRSQEGGEEEARKIQSNGINALFKVAMLFPSSLRELLTQKHLEMGKAEEARATSSDSKAAMNLSFRDCFTVSEHGLSHLVEICEEMIEELNPNTFDKDLNDFLALEINQGFSIQAKKLKVYPLMMQPSISEETLEKAIAFFNANEETSLCLADFTEMTETVDPIIRRKVQIPKARLTLLNAFSKIRESLRKSPLEAAASTQERLRQQETKLAQALSDEALADDSKLLKLCQALLDFEENGVLPSMTLIDQFLEVFNEVYSDTPLERKDFRLSQGGTKRPLAFEILERTTQSCEG